MTGHRFRFFSIGLCVGASLGLLFVSRPGSEVLVDDLQSGQAGDTEAGHGASARPTAKALEVVRDSGMQAYRDALGQRW